MEVIALVLLAWWAWSIWYKKTHAPVPVVAAPLGLREGNYARAVPAGNNRAR